MSDVVFQFEEGLIIMLIGMGVVFLFLGIMVASMGVMGRVLQKINLLYPEPVEEPATAASAPQEDDECVAVAIAAVMARN